MSRNALSRKKAKIAMQAVIAEIDPELHKQLEKDAHMYTWEDLVDMFVRGYGHQ